MAAKLRPQILDPVWDKIVAMITARATADGIQVGEVIKGLHGDVKRMQDSGIYVLSPRFQPHIDTSLVYQDDWDFPIYCFVRGFEEASQSTAIMDLVGVAVDAIRADPSLDAVLGLEVAQFVDGDMPLISQGTGLNPGDVEQTIVLRVRLTYD